MLRKVGITTQFLPLSEWLGYLRRAPKQCCTLDNPTPQCLAYRMWQNLAQL